MAEPVTIAGSAAAAAAPAVKKTLESLGKAVANQVGRLTRGVVDRAIVDIGIGFQDYLITSYNRCRCFKTIINPDRPLDTIKSYVHVSLSCGDETLKDDDLIWQLKERNCVVITGLAGSGKSMLMKYLTICKFENPQGILPLFVELRRLNGLRERNLITFIRTSCANTLSRRSEEQFNLALKAGLLMLILDGFDELNHEHRDEIQKQILELHKEFPNTIIVVSSRPDDSRFGSWSAFHVFKVNRLSKAQSIDLIKT